jgi:hypothetical protein
MQIAIGCCLETRIFIPREWGVLGAEPLQHMQVATGCSGNIHYFTPRAWGILSTKPLQHVKAAFPCCLAAQFFIPFWIIQSTHPRLTEPLSYEGSKGDTDILKLHDDELESTEVNRDKLR